MRLAVIHGMLCTIVLGVTEKIEGLGSDTEIGGGGSWQMLCNCSWRD